MGKIHHTQKVVMDWRDVQGILSFGGKWERDGLVPSKGASAFVFVYPLTYIYRFGFI